MSSAIREARQAGYTDDEILERFAKTGTNASQKVSEAKKSGYSSQQILDQLSGQKKPLSEATPKPAEPTLGEQAKSFGKKAARVAGQALIGGVEAATLPYDIGVTGSRITNQLTEAAGVPATGFIGHRAGELPTLAEAIKPLGEAIGFDTEPHGGLEKTVRLAGTLRKTAIKEAEKLALKGTEKLASWLKPEAKKALEGFAASAPLAAATVGAEELFGVPQWASLMGLTGTYIAGKAALQGAGKIAQWAGKQFFLFDPKNFSSRNAVKSFQDEVKRGPIEAREQLKNGLITAEQYQAMKPYLETAQKYEIPLLPSTLSDSIRFKRIERIIAKNDLTEPAAQAFRQQSAERWADSYQRAIKEMANDARFSTREGISEALATDVTRKQHAQMEARAKDLYGESERLFKNSDRISKEGTKEIEDSLTQVYKQLGESRIPNTGERSTRNIAEQGKEAFRSEPRLVSPTEAGRPELEGARVPKGIALEKLFGPEAKHMELTPEGRIQFKKNVPLPTAKELTATIRSLNSTVNWEYPDVVNMLKGPRQVMNSILDREYATKAPTALAKLREANKVYGDAQNLFGQDARWKKWGLRQDVLPNELEGTIKNLERFKAFEKDFGHSKEGRQLLDYMKRRRVEEKLEPLFSKDMYKPGQISAGLRQLERDPEFRYMVPDQSRKNLRELADLDSRIQRTSSKSYIGAADQGERSDLQALWWSLANPSQWAFKLANTVSKNRLAETYADIFMNPQFTDEMKAIGEDTLKVLQSGKPEIGKIQLLKDRIQLFWDDVAAERKIISRVAPSRIETEEPER